MNRAQASVRFKSWADAQENAMDTMDIIRRWNFDADDDGVFVCKGLHESSDHCEAHMERMSPHEVLEVLNTMRAQALRLEAELKRLQPNV